MEIKYQPMIGEYLSVCLSVYDLEKTKLYYFNTFINLMVDSLKMYVLCNKVINSQENLSF